MSTPLNSKQCRTDASYCRFGGEKLSRLQKAFEVPIAGVLENQDIEFIHKMRVASRRIRAAMPIFQACCPKKKFKKWLFEVKKVTRLLGEARDLDVQIEFVKKYAANLSSQYEKTALEPLLRKHQDRRIALQMTVADGLLELRGSGVLAEMGSYWEGLSEDLSYAPTDASLLEQAYWHIYPKIDDFLSFEKCVHQEDAILKHHQMRIKAKWLRYTMEVFASLYKNELSEEIETIKSLQDVLGEMHDCDVWIDYLPNFINESHASNTNVPPNQETALLNLLAYIKERKKNFYKQFVQIWDEKKQTGFFNNLRQNLRTGSEISENRIEQVISNPAIKIAVMSDIHANLHALEAVVHDAESKGATFFLNAGDSIGFGAFPKEVLDVLYVKKVVSVIGNFDLEVIENGSKERGMKRVALRFAKKELDKSSESYLLSLPFEIAMEVNGKKLFMVHGSPKSIDEHIYHDTPAGHLKELAELARADLIITGHSHEQYHRQIDGVSFLNSGSVGRPSDGKPKAEYALLSFDPFQVELVQLDYDFEGAADALRKKGLPESFAQMVICGQSLEAIIQQDKKRADETTKDCDKLVEICLDLLKSYKQEPRHCEQVRRIALTLYDCLRPLHQMDSRERCWLECASLLHDIGLSEGNGVAHHKLSMGLILNTPAFPFTSEERRIVASITRYHRKGFPKRKHYNLLTLDRSTIKKVSQLSSILRLADGLDYTHESVVKGLDVSIDLTRVNIEYHSDTPSTLDEQAFNKKKDLFEKVFRKKLVLTWMKQ